MNKQEDLGCCPFCGCTNLYIVDESEELFSVVPAIFCNGCKMIVKIENNSPYLDDESTYKYLYEKLVKTWNGRCVK